MANLNDQGDLYDFDVPDLTVPPGTYQAVVMECSLEEGSKAPYVKIHFVIKGGECDGEPLWHNATLSSNAFARRRTKQTFEAILGMAMTGQVNIQKLVQGLPGNFCRIMVTTEEYEGLPQARVGRVLPPAMGDADRLFEAQAKAEGQPLPETKASLDDIMSSLSSDGKPADSPI